MGRYLAKRHVQSLLVWSLLVALLGVNLERRMAGTGMHSTGTSPYILQMKGGPFNYRFCLSALPRA